MMAWITAAAGLAILVASGESLVRGAVNLSLRIGVPALIVSLTVVAFGTSAPELLVMIEAVLEDRPGVALGNVVGSNVANVLLVLGAPAMIATVAASGCRCERIYALMLGATVLTMALALRGRFDAVAGLALLAGLAWFLIDSYREARRGREVPPEEVEGAEPGLSGLRIAVFLVLGMIGLPLGADLTISGAGAIARGYGVSDAVIGLTLVAIGTSLPELTTTVIAALRRSADVVLGNIIGSNMFNLLAILGIGSLVGSIPVDPRFFALDFWVMLAAALALAPFVFLRRDVGRLWGFGLLGAYGVYMALVLG